MERKHVMELCSRIDAALAPLAGEFNVTLKTGNARYDSRGCTIKLEVTVPTALGATREAQDFSINATAWGLKPADLGRPFYANGQRYTIIGAKPRATRYPILVERHDGKRFKFAAHTVRQGLAS